ncbi:MAG: hydroxyethylthiazole kinase [Firmicutes bacterium]|nr:hydroxyethylthiazole kinase [Bacillota bacterium]
MENWGEKIWRIVARVRAERPLIHHITNMVVMNDTANLTLHLGASPVMAHAREEVAEMVGLAGALVLNIGTLTPSLVEAMLLAGRRANELGIPVILDPVGAGATGLRTESARKLMAELKIAVLRGNAAEVSVLAGCGGRVKGVDAAGGEADPVFVACRLAKERGMVVAITGPRDVVSDGERVLLVENGHPLLGSITGTGCMATTAVAVFAAVERDYLVAAAAALAYFGIAGERAAERTSGPGSFKVALLDEVANLTPAILAARARITQPAAEEVGR